MTIVTMATARTTRLCVENHGAEKLHIRCGREGRKRLRLRAVEIFDALLEEQRQCDRRNDERQHAVSEHGIDDDDLEQGPENKTASARPMSAASQNGAPAFIWPPG